MKKLACLVSKHDAGKVLKALAKEGCVELRNTDSYTALPEYADLLSKGKNDSDDNNVVALRSALATVNKYSAYKKGFLAALPRINESEFEDDEDYNKTLSLADEINKLAQDISACDSAIIRLTTSLATIKPFAGIKLALDSDGGRYYSTVFGSVPVGVSVETLTREIGDDLPVEFLMGDVGVDQQYFALLCLKKQEEEVVSALKPLGFSRLVYRDIVGNAAENTLAIEKEIESKKKSIEEHIDAIIAKAGFRLKLEIALDLAETRLNRTDTMLTQAGTQKTLLLSGYTPENCVDRVTGLLDTYCCAFEFSEPDDVDDVPIVLKNNSFVKPYEMVTALYALPKYNSPIDPNPFIAPFFFIYFGLMMGDFAYGVIIALVSFLILKKANPREGTMKKLMQVGILGGVATAIWGILFGSYFGNFIPVITETFTGTAITPPPVLFDPLSEPLLLFGISLAFGAIQLILGMALSMYQKCSFGKPLDAVLDEGLWLLIFAGLGVVGIELGLGVVMPVANLGLYIALVGVVLILLTKGRNEKGIKKVTAGLGELYGITSYLADLLSYSRLLALGLATAVIAQVMNTMGTLLGPTIPGVILLIVVFIVGHSFNIGINILGTFVHTSRLQFIEFFGKFYMPGGRPFKPLCNNTKYVEVLKDEA